MLISCDHEMHNKLQINTYFAIMQRVMGVTVTIAVTIWLGVN
jgi:hypothetical protein